MIVERSSLASLHYSKSHYQKVTPYVCGQPTGRQLTFGGLRKNWAGKPRDVISRYADTPDVCQDENTKTVHILEKNAVATLRTRSPLPTLRWRAMFVYRCTKPWRWVTGLSLSLFTSVAIKMCGQCCCPGDGMEAISRVNQPSKEKKLRSIIKRISIFEHNYFKNLRVQINWTLVHF